MNASCHHFLPGATFPQDQHRVVAERSLGDHPVELLHFRRRPTILPNPSFDLIFARGMRFSVFILKWVATPLQRKLQFVDG